LFITVLFAQTLKSQTYNFDVEKLDVNNKPYQWILSFSPDMIESYPVVVDSTETHTGRYSLRLSKAKNTTSFGSCSIVIPSVYAGEEIVLRGFLKTKNVKNGYAGLWMRLDGKDKTLGFNNMSNRSIKGTNDWHEFSITLNFSEEVKNINVGACL